MFSYFTAFRSLLDGDVCVTGRSYETGHEYYMYYTLTNVQRVSSDSVPGTNMMRETLRLKLTGDRDDVRTMIFAETTSTFGDSVYELYDEDDEHRTLYGIVPA